MTYPGPASTAEGAHTARRSRRIALVCIGVFAIAVIAVGLMMPRDEGPTNALHLRGGGTTEFRGVSRGTRVSLTSLGTTLSRDRDGHAWHHAFSSPLTWREHAHRLAPQLVRDRLPVSWRARPVVSVTIPQEQLLRFESSGAVILKSMWLTWEDSNGFESLGLNSPLSAIHPHGIYTGSLPPGRSPEVILRVRERQESKPLGDWPLLGEVRMKNPVPATPSMTPVDTLPATRTVHGVALTLQSIVVDPAAAGADLTRLQLTMPHENHKDWSADLTFYDERGSQVQIQRRMTSRHSKGITLKASGALWSDAPWHVRLKLANGSTPARIGNQALFTAVPLPPHAPAGRFTKSELVGSVPVTLTNLEPDAASRGERLAIHFTHPALPAGHKFKVVSAIDDLGRLYTWDGGSRNSHGPFDVRCQLYLVVPQEKEPQARSLEVTVEIEEPLVFDFFVLPEFKKRPSASNR